MTNDYSRRYLASYFLTLVVVCFLVAAFNAIIDPYARILLVDRAGFNQGKVALQTNNRTGKANALRQCNYETIVLGNSRAESGIDMNHPVFGTARSYNAALKAATIYEIRRLAEYALSHGSLRTVLLSLDFVSFSGSYLVADDFVDSPLAEEVSPASLTRYLFSKTTFWHSLVTLVWNRAGKVALCGDNGEHKRRAEIVHARPSFDYVLKSYATAQYRNYSVSEDNFEHLSALLRELTGAGVKVYAYISPVHVIHQELKTEMNLRDENEMWRRRLVQVFAEVNRDLTPESRALLWDFGGYNEITMEKIPPADASGDDIFMRWHNDSAHYNKNVGNMLLDRIYGLQSTATVSKFPFGVQLDAENIDEVIASGRLHSGLYRRENPDEIRRMQEMLQKEGG